jgi:4a-hydroxytetrahydrobiopterin dehydratase
VTRRVAFFGGSGIVSFMAKLSSDELELALRTVAEWRDEAGNIVRTFEFKDFVEAMAFVNRVAEISETDWHHPDIDIRWNKVRLALCTHSEGGLTAKDFELARKFDGLAGAR